MSTKKQKQAQELLDAMNVLEKEKGIKKEVRDIIDGVYRAPEVKAEEDTTDLSDEKAVSQRVKQLEKQMAAYARDLEFEKAAAVRDQLDALKKRLFDASVRDLPEKA